MSDLVFKPQMLRWWKPIKNRQMFRDWAPDTGRKGCRTKTYADMREGRPVERSYIEMVVTYLLDIEYRNNPEAQLFRKFLEDSGINEEEWTVQRLVPLLTEPAIPQDPFSKGKESIVNFFHYVLNPEKHVRPCRSEDEVRQVTEWLYIDAGRRLTPGASDSKAIASSKAYVRTSLSKYANRLIGCWRENSWTVAVGGESIDDPCVMTVAIPVSPARYVEIRSGKVDMFRLRAEPGVARSPCLFVEAMARHPSKTGLALINSPGVHLFRTALCQHSMLTDVANAQWGQHVSILSLGCFPEYRRMLKCFGYKNLNRTTPVAGLPLWERELWRGNNLFVDSSLLGVWEGIQRRYHRADEDA